MALLMSLLLSLLLAVFSAIIPWVVARVKRGPLVAAFVVGVALSIASVSFTLISYPWINLIVLLVSLSAGVLLGRSLPAKTWPFLIVLLVLSVLDITQIVLSSQAPAPAHVAAIPPTGQLVGNFFLLLPWGRFNIGLFDIFIIAAISEHARKRGLTFVLALLPSVLGIVLAFAFRQFIYNGTLPLIPFLTIGWICDLALVSWYRQRVRAARSQVAAEI
ncbi:MAG: hypothetical protein ACRDHP_04035 [Ktedonobacterales bacterium]